MDGDALDTSEYYRDAQLFQALRKRKWKNDSAVGSGESCSKNKAVELLPVILESKSGRVLKTYNLCISINVLKSLWVRTRLVLH